jgi:hypothetical protein
MATMDELANRIGDATDSDVTIELLDWLEARVDGRAQAGTAALATGLASVLSQTSDTPEQAAAVAKVFSYYLQRTVNQMQQHDQEHPQ